MKIVMCLWWVMLCSDYFMLKCLVIVVMLVFSVGCVVVSLLRWIMVCWKK